MTRMRRNAIIRRHWPAQKPMKVKSVRFAALFLAVGVALWLFWERPWHAQHVTIRVIGEAVSTVDAIQKLSKQYTAETGVDVDVEKYEFDSALEKSTLDLTSHSGAYDIVLQYGPALGRFANLGALYTVPELEKLTGQKADFTDDLFPMWHDLSWYKGKQYGYPFAANTMYVWYRKDLIDDPKEKVAFQQKYGYNLAAPTTWQQYHDLAEFFTRPQQHFFGTIVQGKRHPAVWYEWLNFAYSFGGGVMDKSQPWEYGPIIINSPETVRATEYYKSLAQFSPPGVTNFTWDDALAEMQQGKIFMCIMWSDSVFGVEDPAASKVVGKVGFAPLPVGPAGKLAQVAGGSYFVSRYSRNPGEAFKFILWMMRRDNQIAQELDGGASARESVYQDPRVEQLPYVAAHTASLAVGRHMSDTIPEATQESDIIELALSNVLSGQASPQQALDAAAVDLHALLGDKCPLRYQPQK